MFERIRNYFYGPPEVQEKRGVIAHYGKHPHLSDENRRILNDAKADVRRYDRRKFFGKVGAGLTIATATVAAPALVFNLRNKNENAEPEEEPSVDLESYLSELLRRPIRVEFDEEFTPAQINTIKINAKKALEYLSDLTQSVDPAVWEENVIAINYTKRPALDSRDKSAVTSFSPDGQTLNINMTTPALKSVSTHVNEFFSFLKIPDLGESSSWYISDAMSTIVHLMHEKEKGPDSNNQEPSWREVVNARLGAVFIPDQQYDLITSNYNYWFTKFANHHDMLWLAEVLNMEAALEIEKAYSGNLKKSFGDYLRLIQNPRALSPEFSQSLEKLRERKMYSREQKLPEETTEVLFAWTAPTLTRIIIYRMIITPNGEIGSLPRGITLHSSFNGGIKSSVESNFERDTAFNYPFETIKIIVEPNINIENLTLVTSQQEVSIIFPK